MKPMTGNIYVGIGGWSFEPWRTTFYPPEVSQKKELAYASQKLTSIEINATYYGSFKPETFAKWRDETPDGFVFAVKGSRYTTNRRVLAEAGPSIEKFITGGVTALKDKLGPFNWQFAATKKFDADDFEAFLKLLPKSHDGIDLRHAVEVRNDSFKDPAFIDLIKAYDVAVVVAGDCEFPQIADLTAPFAYVRMMGSSESEPNGYSDTALDQWTERLKTYAAGKVPDDLEAVTRTSDGKPRDVFAYIISGFKDRNPLAAMALITKL